MVGNVMEPSPTAIEIILQAYAPKKEYLIPILQQVQRESGYISVTAIERIACYLNISPNAVYGVATFYKQFKFHPPGKHLIKVCMGTACHVKEGNALLDTIESELGIAPGETTSDRLFTLERVACLGCCALAPTVVIDGKVYGKMSRDALKEILNDYICRKETE
jgi:NADH-quinone oxidoreductase subunit E